MEPDSQPNIVLVTIDSLRADHCGYIQGGCDVTPTITEMAREGTAFTQAIAPGPSTPESMPVAFTGEYPVGQTRESDVGLVSYREQINHHVSARETLAERFSRRGYATAAFTPNPFTSRHFGFDQGFDHFQDFLDSTDEGSGLYDRLFEGFIQGNSGLSFLRVIRNFLQREEVFKPWESYYADVVDWIEGASEPYFVWVFLMDAHNPYLPSTEYRSQSRLKELHANVRFWWESHETPFSPAVHERLTTAYEDAVRYSDAFLDRLRSDLSDTDPVFVVHGDHGEAFGEHGTYGHEPYLYPENVHVPLVVSDGQRASISDPVSLRYLPDILMNVAAQKPLTVDYGPYAVTRTLQGNDTALYTTDTRHSRDDTAVSAESEEVVLSEQLIDRFVSSQREKKHVTAAVGELADI